MGLIKRNYVKRLGDGKSNRPLVKKTKTYPFVATPWCLNLFSYIVIMAMFNYEGLVGVTDDHLTPC